MFIKDSKRNSITVGQTQDYIFRNITLTTIIFSLVAGLVEVKLYRKGKIIQLVEKMPLSDLFMANRLYKQNLVSNLQSCSVGSIKLEELDQLIVSVTNNTASTIQMDVAVFEDKLLQPHIVQYNVIKQNSFTVKGCIQIYSNIATEDEINIEVPGMKISNTLSGLALLTLNQYNDTGDNVLFRNEIPLDVKVDTDHPSPIFFVTKVDNLEESKNAHVKYSKVVQSNSVANKLVKTGVLPQPIHYNQMEA